MGTLSEEIRKNIDMMEYNISLLQPDPPKDYDDLNLTADQKILVKALYETDLFSIDTVMSGLRQMLSKK